MAQAFVTTYDKAYPWKKINRRKTCKPEERVYKEAPVADIWIPEEPEVLDQEAEYLRKKGIVERLYRDRVWSTYQVSYCKEQIAKQTNVVITKPKVVNEILEYGKRLFGKRTQKVLRPMPTARKLYGYIRPSTMYIPFTEYQYSHSRKGFYFLSQNEANKNENEE